MPVILHAKNITYPACTDPSKLNPDDWNSTHLNYLTLAGNTLGASTMSGSNIILSGGNNITLSADGLSLGIIGPAAGGGVALSVSDNLYSSGTMVLSGGANVTIGTNGQTVTISAAAGGGGGVGIYAGTDTVTFTSGNVRFYPLGQQLQIFTGDTQRVYISIDQDHHYGLTGPGAQNLIFGNTTAPGFPQLQAYKSAVGGGQQRMDLQFSMNATRPVDAIRFISVSHTDSIATAAYIEHLARMGVSTQGNTGGTTGLISGGNQSLLLVGSNNISLSQSSDSNGATVSIYGAAGVGGGVAISASNSLWSSGTVTLTGSRNITVGTAAGQIVITGPDLAAYLTTAAQVSHSHGNPSLALTNLTGTTASNSAGLTLSLSAAAPGGGGVAISASNSLWSSGTVTLTGSRNITIGTAAGQIVVTGPDLTPYLTTAAQVSHSHGNPSLALTNLTGTTASNSAGLTISLSAGAGGAGGINTFSADGLSSITGSALQVVFSAGPNVTLQQTTAAGAMTLGISVAAPGGGAGYTKSIKFLHEDLIGFNTGSVATSEGTQYIWMPLHMDNAISISQVMMLKSMSLLTLSSSNSSGRQSMSYALSMYIFRRSDFGANSASLTYHTSASGGLSVSRSHTSNQNSISIAWVTNSTGGTSSFSTTGTGSAWVTGLTGPRFFMVPLVTSLSQGEWFLARRHSSTTGGAGYGSSSNPLSISAFAFTLQSGLGMVMPIGSSNSNLSNPFHAIGFGSATAITTNAAMNATVISAGSTALRVPFGVMVNMPWKA